jgi:hypothetical protein
MQRVLSIAAFAAALAPQVVAQTGPQVCVCARVCVLRRCCSAPQASGACELIPTASCPTGISHGGILDWNCRTHDLPGCDQLW